MPSVSGYVTASGDTTLIAAPTGTQNIVVWGLQWGVVDSGLTAKLVSGATDKAFLRGAVGVSSCIGVSATKEPVIQCGRAEALKINLSDTGNVFYNIQYSVAGL
jgi:hypothetical protein